MTSVLYVKSFEVQLVPHNKGDVHLLKGFESEGSSKSLLCVTKNNYVGIT